MPDISQRNLPFYWAFQCLERFYEAGVRHIIISPGSRSTPLTLAAAIHKGFKKHVILDERSAAFFALGIGKSTGMPALLICTSGTAVANYYPAIIEAKKSSVPLIALTADRPPRLQGSGANQTINQQRIFGDYPLVFKDVGLPSEEESKLHELQQLIDNSLKITLDKKGPIHLNFPFDKPLEPEQDFVTKIKAKETNSELEKGEQEYHSDSYGEVPPSIANKINEAKKPLVVIGQLPAGVAVDSCIELAQKINAPVLSEVSQYSSEFCVQQFDGFLRNRDLLDKLKPDLVLRFGLQPASKGLLQALKYWKPIPHVYFSIADMWSDVASSVTCRAKWNDSMFNLNPIQTKKKDWLHDWKKEEATFSARANTLIKSKSTLTDGHVYHILSAKIPSDCFLFFSNSFSARDRSLFGQWDSQQVFTNRGASGIDGITSTAMGTTIGTNKPGILFTGDLAFLHDTNALLNHNKLTQPLVIVVLNNSGGSIFRMLPITEHKEYFNTYFETPQQAKISKLCESYNIDYTHVESIDELHKLDLKGIIRKANPKLHVVECVTDPDQSMELRNNLWGKS
ncbi:MAG: 2-succinyl-5-enolpyruvyl-6-hydroxy-3-cyclohexene-1-carboxylic-acid synthase [Balneolaceae bacterium]|nr:2-succinyl-5-enolpyruvyl-6-hydroxy-3-cyclohexene-1-carboxylic-acid synthase [Balneolaceae bacterium]